MVPKATETGSGCAQFAEYFQEVERLDSDKPLGTSVQGHLVDVFGRPAPTLAIASAQLVALAACLQMRFSDDMVIRYWWQVR